MAWRIIFILRIFLREMIFPYCIKYKSIIYLVVSSSSVRRILFVSLIFFPQMISTHCEMIGPAVVPSGIWSQNFPVFNVLCLYLRIFLRQMTLVHLLWDDEISFAVACSTWRQICPGISWLEMVSFCKHVKGNVRKSSVRWDGVVR